MPSNYADAIARIKSYRDRIRSALAAGAPTQAHRPLDELEIVLNKLRSIARDNGIPEEQLTTVNRTARELRGLFNQIHSAIDEKRTPDYGAVSDAIEQAIERLSAVTLTPAQESQDSNGRPN